MKLTHSQLVSLAQHFDGRSCEEVTFDSFRYGKQYHMDRIGTFNSSDACCLVKKCVWGEDTDDGSCSGKTIVCPSDKPSIDPETCQALSEDDQQTEQKHAGYYDPKTCCEAKRLLGTLTYDPVQKRCTSNEPWGDICCPQQDDDDDDTRAELHVD